MSITYTEEGESKLDDRIEELVVGIINRIEIDPPELKAALRPPQLRVIKSVAPGLNSYCVLRPGGTKIILVGGDLYSFTHHYTRAATTYFLPTEPGGTRPSSYWPQARAAVITTLDWISSPASAPHYPEFELSPYQANAARAFAAYAFRFAICHEIAHVILGHVDAGPTKPRRFGENDFEVLRVSQQQESMADQFGLDLQIRSLPVSSDFITALASTIYFVHITGLLDARLMLLRVLVDESKWKILYTHPPTLERIFHLIGQAGTHHSNAVSGLTSVHYDLARFDGELYDAANRNQDEVADAVRLLVDAEVKRIAPLFHKKKLSKSNLNYEHYIPSSPPPDTTRALLQLFTRSPLAVMRALELNSVQFPKGLRSKEARLRFLIMEQFTSVLPAEFQDFRRKTRAQRAEQLA